MPCWELCLTLVEKDIMKHGGIITGQGGLEFKIYDLFYCQNFKTVFALEISDQDRISS